MTTLFDPPDHLEVALKTIVDVHGYDEVARIVRSLAPSHPVGSAPARSTDPETSHRASRHDPDVGRFSSKSRQAKLLELFSMRDLTDQQATIALVGSHAAPSAFDGCRRRCSDLRAAHYLSDTGRRRKNAGSEELSIIWQLSAAGKQALAHLEETGWSRP
jgi:hypothetical protein